MEEFFYYLETLRIVDPPDALEVLEKTPEFKIIPIYNKCYELMNDAVKAAQEPQSSLFNFSASDSICGAGYGCQNPTCRVGEAADLGVFAALYGDTVTIPNFFERKIRERSLRGTPLFMLRTRLAGDLAVLLHYRPLLEAGVIRVNPARVFHCSRCLRTELDGVELLTDRTNTWQQTAQEFLIESLSVKKAKGSFLLVGDPEHLLSDRDSHYLLLPRSSRHASREMKDNPEALKIDVARFYTGNIVDDLILQNLASGVQKTTFLTQRAIDAFLLDGLVSAGSPTVNVFAKDMVQALPFMENLDAEDILRIRGDESAYFEAYRDAVTTTLRQLGSSPTKKLVSEALSDEINPKIHNLERALKTNRAINMRKAKTKAVSGAMLLAIGFMAKDVINPLAMTAITGGVGAASIFTDVTNATGHPKEVRDNDYYFLWRLKK